MRSFFPLAGFKMVSPLLRLPEYTRRKASWPTNGSVMILKTSAENGASSFGSRGTSSPVAGSFASVGGMSSGEGR